MNGTMRYRKEACLLFGLLATLPQIAVGARDATITVKVTVVAPTCVINNNRPIEVEFGDVMTTRVDGNNYRMPVNYTLDCKNIPSNAMKLKVQGIVAGFDGTLLKTSNSALGIKLQTGATKLSVNTWLNFSYPKKPELWVVPVQKSGSTLTGDEFTAVATMNVDYQ
ncbi:fimbrial protein [Serratia sp. (in: enterobacteria)]|uniref:fimbrial protein n=1 Tax=Serratia sp. (in: enterobacteria) TaxID=616 RepID=UPI00398908E6